MLKRQWSRTMGNLRTIFWLMVSALALASCVDDRLQPEADKPKSGLLVLKGATIYAQPDQAPLENGAIVLEGRQISALGNSEEIGNSQWRTRHRIAGKN